MENNRYESVWDALIENKEEAEEMLEVLEKSSAQYHDGNHVSTEELKANLKARFGV
ncbi:hypothetical protein vB_PsyM_KIL3b_0162 [Pseudomonas phage vB_PsyM_KIL3b]|uniref:Uncharacterized protein n=6 Tax=Flaumdravirus TaxID=2560133 RepID=A0A142IEB2_9CAUD|nr:hypothetical protein BH774_gp042 [Pseudomonas phage vB_PsyM_KIL1]YP_009616847.1 hypothetical protein FDI83_gp043 [Pseudomonas phage vB_PsyM_KIL4]AMR57567.1 hypothetical protein vB_PsyM_KIL2_0167 [Pseudomonas phage vB_PsyM_KIL2]AMR57729.1 hypothetical protein vB_PsyM_KIL3_0162 [Pseudomonas phage vB_PsyM_KIL3]AMR58063.1 hypothetical protein vB_PsyM_KIL5_0172 [Pseudomonas phage vB_PsyM_KIL5]AMR58227.1 hypothetical protein vB_PsyM_KIL3b_0162 [Pseudomonas phage vB_PsyM_KIL3b]AMR57407.1 hypothet